MKQIVRRVNKKEVVVIEDKDFPFIFSGAGERPGGERERPLKNKKGETKVKKLLILGAVMALLAVLVAPMAAFAVDVNIGGSVPQVASILTMTVPSAISTWSLTAWNTDNGGWIVVGLNYGRATSGSMVFKQGNDGVTGWGITAAVPAGYIGPTGYAQMWASNWLPTPIKLSNDGSAFYQFAATDKFSYSGTTDGTTPLDLYAEQQVNTTDAAGVYGLVVVYTLTPTP